MNDAPKATQETPRSIYDVEVGDRWWMVQHNDNSDHGRIQVFFPSEQEAFDYAAQTVADPPEGNYEHPAPETLDVRLFAVERLPVPGFMRPTLAADVEAALASP